MSPPHHGACLLIHGHPKILSLVVFSVLRARLSGGGLQVRDEASPVLRLLEACNQRGDPRQTRCKSAARTRTWTAPAKTILVPGMYFFGFSRYAKRCSSPQVMPEKQRHELQPQCQPAAAHKPAQPTQRHKGPSSRSPRWHPQQPLTLPLQAPTLLAPLSASGSMPAHGAIQLPAKPTLQPDPSLSPPACRLRYPHASLRHRATAIKAGRKVQVGAPEFLLAAV